MIFFYISDEEVDPPDVESDPPDVEPDPPDVEPDPPDVESDPPDVESDSPDLQEIPQDTTPASSSVVPVLVPCPQSARVLELRYPFSFLTDFRLFFPRFIWEGKYPLSHVRITVFEVCDHVWLQLCYFPYTEMLETEQELEMGTGRSFEWE